MKLFRLFSSDTSRYYTKLPKLNEVSDIVPEQADDDIAAELENLRGDCPFPKKNPGLPPAPPPPSPPKTPTPSTPTPPPITPPPPVPGI